MTDKPTLTTTGGAPVPDNQNSITAGPRGPVLMEDYQLIEKLAHQNRERIAERVVHAKGWGAHGTLTIENDISKYTKAKVLPAKQAPQTLNAMYAASPSSSIQKRETGTWLAITHRSSLSAMLTSFPTSFTPRNGILKRTCVLPPRCGISGRFHPNHCIR